jgi:hypothetical protein
MSAINTYFEAVLPGPSSTPYSTTGSGSPLHCATEMEMVIPALGSAVVEYTFEPEEGPVQLPPVWRCSCGFQLDAWATGWPETPQESLTQERRVPVLTANTGA